MMPFLRELFWLSAIYNFKITAKFVPGKLNILADTISRLHEDGQIFVLESLLRQPYSTGAYNIRLPLHASISGILFLFPQMQKWLSWKLAWMQR